MLQDKRPLREEIFTSHIEKTFFDWYHKLFNIAEIESSEALKWFFGATLLSFLATFDSWISNHALTVGNYVANNYSCWPWFQSCGEYYFLEMLPDGYSQTTFYMGLFSIIFLIGYLMYRQEWVLAHLLLTVLLIWKILAGFILSYQLLGNYDYYHFVFAIILLFLPLKLYFLKLVFVLFYTLSATAKIHASWIAGTYFSALQTGLPIFPFWSIPLLTNLVMIMQIVGAWFLLSNNKFLQKSVFVFFVIFHLYSGVLVEYRYPLTVLPSLIILFGLFYYPQTAPLSRKSIAGWCLVSILIILQLTSVFIPGDERLTGEANKFGMYMFEANHQCISQAVVYLSDGTSDEIEKASKNARHRCDPYQYWFRLKNLCNRYEDVERVEWTFDHSLNGGPFYRIVDEEDICGLDYKLFINNEWIKNDKTAPIIGWPVKNQYY